MKRYITVPIGRHIALGEYVKTWRLLKTLPPMEEVKGWSWWAVRADVILEGISYGVHDRINRLLPWFNKGRKWEWNYQTETRRAARALNTPRLIIHWLPSWLRPRFEHRIREAA